ncbi:hypothetical protein SCHPADRAFT_992784 [Schizopora paradoxa]|uniref:MYND-type domain-containing protein n=1 Tax=Schizopora paradoxa TaxID=27342 RepID=A0A0H2S5L7_9AGAM|nr:hypothetical protein SCHPADRAFT_992784 [Schizopora paradoxa]
MSCADCDHCKADLARFLNDPIKCIKSAGRDTPQSLEDLRTVVFNGSKTPPQHVDAALSMFFAHLSAGDQSNFDPVKPTPPRLRRYEERAFLSMAGLSAIFKSYTSFSVAPFQILVDKWPKIRKWIHHLFYRALSKGDIDFSSMSEDELRCSMMEDDWSVYHMVVRILMVLRQDTEFFTTELMEGGNFTLMVKLWARMVHASSSVSVEHRRMATLLFADCIYFVSVAGNPNPAAQLIDEVNGGAKAIAAYIVKPLSDAASMPPYEFSTQADFLAPTILLIHRLVVEVRSTGNAYEKSGFGPAFFDNPNTNPKRFVAEILKKYTAIYAYGDPPLVLREIVGISFQLCDALLLHPDAVAFIIKLLDDGLLDAYANMAQCLQRLTGLETKPATLLLKDKIGCFLVHGAVIKASKNALHRLERDRKKDYMALRDADSGLKDAWQYFTGNAFERAIFKGLYDSKYRKADKLSCGHCLVSMNEQTLKKCSGCKFVHYCSTECQRNDWKEHRMQCKILTQSPEVYQLTMDTKHFQDRLVRHDVYRHLPGLNALAKHDPRTRDDDVLLAYRMDYTTAPPTFSVFPAVDVANDDTYNGTWLANNPVSQADRRKLVEIVKGAKGEARIVQVKMYVYMGTRSPTLTFRSIWTDVFNPCFPAVPLTFNPERPRAVDEENKPLDVQFDYTDNVMVDAMHGRVLPFEELRLFVRGLVHPKSIDQDKTLFERVDDAVKRRKDQKETPHLHEQSGH